MSESAEQPAVACCVERAVAYPAEPVPVLGPYIGVVGAVLCGLVGAFLLLAPYAFDYRDGAASVPRSSVVDLVTGGCVLLLGLLTAGLFAGALAERLRVPQSPAYAEGPPEQAAAAAPAQETADPQAPTAAAPAYPPPGEAPASEPEARPAAPAASLADPGGALRDLLTPLVAALAADLRARESGENEGRHP